MTNLLELHVPETDIKSGSIPVHWCIDKELLDEIKENYSQVPQLLITVVNKNDLDVDLVYAKERRYVVPLTDLMTYVEFNKPGETIIFACIIYPGISAKKDMLLKRSYNEYYYNAFVFGCDKDDKFKLLPVSPNCLLIINTINNKYDKVYTQLTVDVPNECFATEPPEWEKTWVNHFCSFKAFDQCSYRKRRLFAYTVQPILIFVLWLVRLLICLCLLLLTVRGVSWKSVYKPLTYQTNNIWDEIERPLLVHKKLPDQIGLVLMLFFSPLSLISIAIISYFTSFKFLLIGLIGFGLVVACLIGLFSNLKYARKKRPVTIKPLLLDEDLVCQPGKRYSSVSDLPKRKRTIRLRYLDLKSKVCKPFVG